MIDSLSVLASLILVGIVALRLVQFERNSRTRGAPPRREK
jgi:hypothetical protein